MRLLYVDYVALVLELSNRKRQDGTSSSLLASATPANIKQECMNVYSERWNRGEKKDEKALKDFFGSLPEGKDYSTLIKRSRTEKFKPVQNLINGKIKSPDIINVELLAWLIDFPHRPFKHEMDVDLSEGERAVVNNVRARDEHPTSPEESETPIAESRKEFIMTSVEEQPSAPVPKPIKQKRKWIKLTAGFLLTAGLLAGGYSVLKGKESRQLGLLNEDVGCMYWAGDHYEKMPCRDDRKDRLKLPLDAERMNTFKKITREDTITEKSIDKIYYIKIDGAIEYYTAGGNHPIDVTRTLQKLSAYMFTKHLKKNSNGKKSL